MKFTAFVILVLALIAGCTTAPEDDCGGSARASGPYIGEPVFDRCAGFSVTVDRTSYSIGDTLSLRVAFTPLYSGVGEVVVWFLPLEGRPDQRGVVVAGLGAPASGGGVAWKVEVDITGEGRMVAPIEFMVNDDTPYHITATVRFTSVYDAVTEQLYVMGSDEQKDVFGPLDHTAYGSSVPFELPRPAD